MLSYKLDDCRHYPYCKLGYVDTRVSVIWVSGIYLLALPVPLPPSSQGDLGALQQLVLGSDWRSPAQCARLRSTFDRNGTVEIVLNDEKTTRISLYTNLQRTNNTCSNRLIGTQVQSALEVTDCFHHIQIFRSRETISNCLIYDPNVNEKSPNVSVED